MNTEGEYLKISGMADVLEAADPTWSAKYDALAVEFYKGMATGAQFSGEDLHEFIEYQVEERPHKPQAWSAKFNGFIKRLIAAGTVVPVDYRKSLKASNHSRICRVYQKVA